ncbi:MAG TPA: murein L,D-transpeptidase catalytic domain family protein [Gemmatimonadaceae bacterium]|nr:murein L,D-transpeptidase catalytic domain family protein [Gemmatimonadaceae bacterium]
MRKLLILVSLAVTAPALHAVPVSSYSVSRAAAPGYDDLGLSGIVSRDAYDAAMKSADARGVTPHMLAIADMTQPSTAQRLVIIDLDAKKIALRTWVAHGQNSGELNATRFSNADESHETSLGLYRVGARIESPKHGAALLLDGLEKGVNDNARSREIIVHAADYVSAGFIAAHGRLGRSWGCPAVSPADMARVSELLADGGFLYING